MKATSAIMKRIIPVEKRPLTLNRNGGKSGIPLSDEEKRLILELFHLGKSGTAISQGVGRSLPSVLAFLRKNGLRTRNIKDRNFWGTFNCQTCGKTEQKKSGSQKYCFECREGVVAQRQLEWLKNNPPTEEQTLRWRQAQRERREQAGAKISKSLAENITVDMTRPVDCQLGVRIVVPFSYSVSKNARASLVGGAFAGANARVILAKRAREYQNDITMLVRGVLRGRKFFNNKVWLDIFVQKPNHLGDAVNVVDTVCDGVKHAIGVDDRWFSIRRLDWQITKSDPHLIIGVLQEDCFDAQCCSTCGRVLPVQKFDANKSAKTGFTRICKECKTADRSSEEYKQRRRERCHAEVSE